MVLVMDLVIIIAIEVIGEEPHCLDKRYQNGCKSKVFLFHRVKGISCFGEIPFGVGFEKVDVHPDF